jgi:hypothetical protein
MDLGMMGTQNRSHMHRLASHRLASHRLASVSGPVLLLLLLVGCSETTTSRCNRLVSISNRTTEAIQKLPGENLQPSDRFTKAAELLERSAQEIQDLKLNDEKLTDFQKQLSDLYRQDSTHNRQLAAAQNAKAMRTAADQIQKNSITQKNLVQVVNAYCQATGS